MMINYEMEQNGDMILITARGVIEEVDDIICYTKSFIQDLKRHSPETALLDHRELTGELNVIDNVRVITEYAKAIKELKQVKVAVVTTVTRMGSLTFLETIAQNVGIMGLAFDDIEEARDWLQN